MRSRCTIPGCDRVMNGRGFCGMHYARWAKHGDPLATVPEQAKPRVILRTQSEAPCSDCKQLLPLEAFAPHRSRCRVCHSKLKRLEYLAKRTPCVDCGELGAPETERCRACTGRLRRKPPSAERRAVDNQGYVRLAGYYDHPNAISSRHGQLFEHTKVMVEILGRPLRKGENVHHKNGVRDDNRPENLELWVSMQPSGQRPADLVAWAYEILDRYASEVAA